jgi:hypothetical protein
VNKGEAHNPDCEFAAVLSAFALEGDETTLAAPEGKA